MPINEESKQAYLQARDIFVDSYKDYLHKLLGLLMEAEQSTSDADVRRDVAHFADEVKLLQSHINDYLTEEELAKKRAVMSASSSGSPRGSTSQDELNRAPSPGEQPESPTPVPLLGTDRQSTTSGSEKSLEEQAKQKSTSKSKSTSRDESAEEMQAEVESQPSQLSPTSEESVEEMPEIMPPPHSDDGRVVSAFCAFRYHKDEFRQLFLRPQQQGSNSNSEACWKR